MIKHPIINMIIIESFQLPAVSLQLQSQLCQQMVSLIGKSRTASCVIDTAYLKEGG